MFCVAFVPSGAQGGQDGGPRGPNNTFWKFGVPRKPLQKNEKSPQEHPKRGPQTPQTSKRASLNPKSWFFQKSSFRRSEIEVFEGGRVGLGAHNRQEEAPRRGKQRLGRRGRANTGTKHTNIARKGQPKAFQFQGLRGTLTLLRRGFDVPSTGVIFAVDVAP